MPYVLDWLDPYDPLDLLAGLGGLQLMPENADHLLRLEMLAPVVAVSASSATDKKPVMSPRRWRDLVNGPLITNTAIPRLEDAQTAEFADELTFFDGSYLVLPGTNADATFMARQLLRALLLTPIPFPDADVAEYAKAAAGLLLVLSDRAARGAGLVRGQVVVHTGEGSVIVPEAARFSMLKEAVTFEQGEIDHMLLWSRMSRIALDRLLLAVTADDAQLEDPDGNPLLDAPLVRVGDRVVVVAPDLVLTALCRSIASFAIERGSMQYVAEAFRSAVATSVSESLKHLDLPVLPLKTADSIGRPFSSAWFGLDRDKLLLSVVVTDPMNEGLPLPADWHPDALGGEIAEHIVQSVTRASNLAPPPDGFSVWLQCRHWAAPWASRFRLRDSLTPSSSFR